MAAKDRTTLKSYFNAGDVPTEQQYVDLIDSFPLISEPVGDADTLDTKHASDFALVAKGVTNGDSHDHYGGDGSAIGTNAIENGAVTNAKLADMAQSTVKGRISTGTGDPEDLNQANLRTIIGAGSGNGLDSDKLDGLHADTSGLNAHAVATDANGATTISGVLTASKGLLASGTSFPASPTTGQQFFRSDLGLWCYYDGTRWLTDNEYSISCPKFSTTGSTTVDFGAIRNDKAIYFTRVVVETYVSTTNDSSNYYGINIQSFNRSRASGSSIHWPTTQSDSPNTWCPHDANSNTAPSGYGFLDLEVYKQSNPGEITVLATVYYRLIIT